MLDAAVDPGRDAAVRTVERAAGSAAGNILRGAILRAAAVLDHEDFSLWLQTLVDLAVGAPDAFAVVAMRGEDFLAELDMRAFRRWVMAGIAIPEEKAGARLQHFGLTDAGALQAMALMDDADSRLEGLERPLAATALALWKVRPLIRPISPAKARRASFNGPLIRMPTAFPGFRGRDADSLFQAAVSHIGAHQVFTRRKLAPAALKPVQIALVSLLEDARVELLAGAQYPGLLRLWRSLHVAEASGPGLAEPLLARLARALIDPAYDDVNPWVAKGRQMFLAAWQRDDPAALREIGVLLGNDLGQMRIQFNAKTYVVQPPYRDDNQGLWNFETPPDAQMQDEVVYDSVRIEQRDDQPGERDQTEDDSEVGRARTAPPDPDLGVAVARYPEWDYLAARMHPDWTTLVEYRPRPSRPQIIDHVVSGYADIQRRINALVSHARVSRPTRLRRQPEGDRLDLDATIRAVIDKRAGLAPDSRIYEHTALLHRDLSVLLLLDVSESTKDTIRGTHASVFSVERAATALLAEAMAGIGDPFAVHAFCSNGRNDVRFLRIKEFSEPYGRAPKSRLAGLKPGYSTRLGAALRHAGTEIAGQQTYRRLILIVTDGEPSDVDVKDRSYLTEDARKAVQELSHQGIDVLCVGLAVSGATYLDRIFGRNVLRITRIESLPEKLPMLYFRLRG